MQYSAKVLEVSTLIEEEAVFDIKGQKIVAFIYRCPFVIFQGRQYLIDLDLDILDDFLISKFIQMKKVLNR